MDYKQIVFSIEDTRVICNWIVSMYSPQRMLLFGQNDTDLVQCCSESSVEVVNFDPENRGDSLQFHQGLKSSSSSKNDFDVALLSQEMVSSFVDRIYPYIEEGLRIRVILVYLPVDTTELLLPGVAHSLWEIGFARNLSIQKKIGETAILFSFDRENLDVASRIESYEIELSRVGQISEKRLERINEYRNDFYQEIRLNQLTVIKMLEFENRWRAFWNSRTGKVLLAFQRYRQRLVPAGSRRQWFIGLFPRAYRAMRREGFTGFFRALPGWLNVRIKRFMATRWNRIKIGDQERQGYIEPICARSELVPHTDDVDIVICVHNALEDVIRCLNSIEAYTSRPYNIILVDDGSGIETAQFLAEYSQEKGILLLRSEQATGYTYAANRGLRASKAEFVVLLNSDTIVTHAWLDHMILCAQSDPRIGVVGPLSNTASWQSIPKIEDEGDWAENPLPEGISVEKMGGIIAEYSARLYPEMPLLNGFCLMIKRQLIEEIGMFDEESFGAGYGEEDDFALRARKSGWKLALADDTYIYHAQSRSYSNERRKLLSDRAGKLLAKKHGQEIIRAGVEFCHHNRVMEGIRARAAVAMERYQCIGQGSRYKGKRILFILPITTPGGGANVIRGESLAMRKMGVEVDFFNLLESKNKFTQAYPNFELPMLYGDIEDIPDVAPNYDAVIATYNPTVAWMQAIKQTKGKPIRGYYVQGYEPLMYHPYSSDYEQAVKSYSLLNDLVRFTKTNWTQKMVYENTGQKCNLIGVSFDLDLYRPRPIKEPDWPYRPIRISAMVRPESPYREPHKTMQLLKDISDAYGSRVEIHIFGTDAKNPDFLTLPINFNWKCYGVLIQEQVANLLNHVDIFVDYSSHQAMGLTALEAMSCGCAVVVPENGGATSFALHEKNSIVVDTSSYENVLKGVKHLIEDDRLRTTIQRNAIYDVCSYFPERAALNILDVLFGV